jgi:hypothetical protein
MGEQRAESFEGSEPLRVTLDSLSIQQSGNETIQKLVTVFSGFVLAPRRAL